MGEYYLNLFCITWELYHGFYAEMIKTCTKLIYRHILFHATSVSYVVARGVRPHGVFSSQGDAAHRNDQQDAHFKVAQRTNVVTRSPKPVGSSRFASSLRPFIAKIRSASYNNKNNLDLSSQGYAYGFFANTLSIQMS